MIEKRSLEGVELNERKILLLHIVFHNEKPKQAPRLRILLFQRVLRLMKRTCVCMR